jgi:hypothetical protein
MTSWSSGRRAAPEDRGRRPRGCRALLAFDTGFVAYHRGWDSLRDEDRGQLLEHLVLGEIAARFGVSRLHYWRDKIQGFPRTKLPRDKWPTSGASAPRTMWAIMRDEPFGRPPATEG